MPNPDANSTPPTKITTESKNPLKKKEGKKQEKTQEKRGHLHENVSPCIAPKPAFATLPVSRARKLRRLGRQQRKKRRSNNGSGVRNLEIVPAVLLADLRIAEQYYVIVARAPDADLGFGDVNGQMPAIC
eukprot:2379200-Rhodomonas_salina.1